MALSLQVAVQMDPFSVLDLQGDTTLGMMLEAHARGHKIFCYQPKTLGYAFGDGEVRLEASGAQVEEMFDDAPPRLASVERRELKAFDVLLMRQDPPFDMAYISTTYMLEHLLGEVVVVNHPAAVRDAPEKLLVARFPHLTPATLISSHIDALEAFRVRWGDVMLKPLYGNGGWGVVQVTRSQKSFRALAEYMLAKEGVPLIIQRFLPEIEQGDKRIIMVNGKGVGALNRLPAEDEVRANLHVGGQGSLSSLTARDKEICAEVGPVLREKGVLFAGLDVIGGWLTEINITSPTGVREIKRMGGADIMKLFWDAIEEAWR